MGWQIIVRPEGKNPGSEEGRNEGGMFVGLKGDTGGVEEIQRVAWVRENSSNPRVPFDAQLDDVMEKAKKAVAVLQELTADAGTLT